jgi:hypothetical protein
MDARRTFEERARNFRSWHKADTTRHAECCSLRIGTHQRRELGGVPPLLGQGLLRRAERTERLAYNRIVL